MVSSGGIPGNVRNLLATAARGAQGEAARAMPTCLKLAGGDAPAAGAPELGDPLPIIRLGLNGLKARSNAAGLAHFLPLAAPGTAATATVPEVVYPVFSGPELAGSVTLEQQEGGKWKPTVFNNLGVSKALFDAKQTRQASRPSGNEQYTGISVRALGLFFLAVLRDNGDLFIPLASDKEIGFEKDVPVPAEQALATLSRLANSHNGQPG
jgi:hypothetical protein